MPRSEWERIDQRVVVESENLQHVLDAIDPDPPFPEKPSGTPLRRVALDIRVPKLHEIEWEELIQQKMPSLVPIVRVSRVVPRVAQSSFTLPLRILLVGWTAVWEDVILGVFGRHDPEVVAEAVTIETAHDIEKPRGWPVVDVVHLPGLPLFTEEELLSPSMKRRWSMGWISRQLDEWQTRLLILDALPHEIALARRLGAALVARGGPAVVVRRTGCSAEPFYDRIIHDYPIDVIPDTGIDVLFGGAGREELVRVSNAGEAVAHVARSAFRPVNVSWQFETALSGFAEKFDGYTFYLHEADGLIPMVGQLRDMREAARLEPWFDRSKQVSTKPRHVNGSLLTEDGKRVDAMSNRLTKDTDYQLRIGIGLHDHEIPVYGSSIFTEVPKTSPEQRGVWVEVAVNGVGFSIEGDHVQPLWVPFDDASDTVTFSVRPTQKGVGVLRYTLYYQQNVLQTFRIAALVSPFPTTGSVSAQESIELAEALDIPHDEAPLTTWIARLEYEGAAITEAETQHERDLSIVANDVAGKRVITVKGEEFFTDAEAGDIESFVRDVRDALLRSSLDQSFPDRRDWLYRFGKTAGVNAQSFEEALRLLASAGWELYNRVLPYGERQRIEKTLQGEGKKIAVAHTLLEHVIPWAAVYERMFVEPAGGKAEICTASLPDTNGTLPATACGTLAGCPLTNGSNPKHVACALPFWGFRHVIEVPPKQGASTATPVAAQSPAPPPRLAAVVNASLKTAKDHLSRLAQLKRKGASITWAVEDDPAAVITALEAADLDVVYLYCHARGGTADPQIKPPCIEFSHNGKTVRIRDSELDFAPWPTKPLVILNGCSSAAYSAEALAPFVRKFTRDRQAGGVLGTEIPVHELLAGEVAEQFLARYLNGEQAGAALLAVRRKLLAEKNPLGLAYTLYAVSELSLRDA